ncbi:MAG TPA: carboxypeptidase-like regulatory domain-containing protein [Longimicrobiaceae bacterium]
MPRSSARARAGACVSALLLAVAGSPAGAQTIVGRVIDESGAAVPGARIMVTGGGQREPRRTATGADGRYAISLPGGGTFRVQATRAGYEAAPADPVSVGPRDTVVVDLRLRSAAVPLRALKASVRRPRLPVRGKFRAVFNGDSTALRPVSAAGRSRRIEAQGTMPTPTACYQLAGAAERTGSVVTLNVEARPTDDCPGGPGTFTYGVAVRGLPAGSYTFRIVHTYRDTAWQPVMALDTTIAVP